MWMTARHKIKWALPHVDFLERGTVAKSPGQVQFLRSINHEKIL